MVYIKKLNTLREGLNKKSIIPEHFVGKWIIFSRFTFRHAGNYILFPVSLPTIPGISLYFPVQGCKDVHVSDEMGSNEARAYVNFGKSK